jgi:hypothetical protein
LVLSRVRLIRVRLVLVNLNPINDTYIHRQHTCSTPLNTRDEERRSRRDARRSTAPSRRKTSPAPTYISIQAAGSTTLKYAIDADCYTHTGAACYT